MQTAMTKVALVKALLMARCKLNAYNHIKVVWDLRISRWVIKIEKIETRLFTNLKYTYIYRNMHITITTITTVTTN